MEKYLRVKLITITELIEALIFFEYPVNLDSNYEK